MVVIAPGVHDFPNHSYIQLHAVNLTQPSGKYRLKKLDLNSGEINHKTRVHTMCVCEPSQVRVRMVPNSHLSVLCLVNLNLCWHGCAGNTFLDLGNEKLPDGKLQRRRRSTRTARKEYETGQRYGSFPSTSTSEASNLNQSLCCPRESSSSRASDRNASSDNVVG